MNDLIKNIDIEYTDRGWDKLYPTDATFVKLWQAADYFEDVADALSRHLTKRLHKTASERLAVSERWLAQLRNADSMDTLLDLQGIDKDAHNIVLDWQPYQDGRSWEIMRDLRRATGWFNVYPLLRIENRPGMGLKELEERLTENIKVLRAALSKNFKCYDNGDGHRKNAYLRGKARRFQNKYSITLKDLPNRPEVRKARGDDPATIQALAEEYLQKYNDLEAA